MSAFIETTIYGEPALVNVDAIEMVTPRRHRGEETSLIRWRRPSEREGDIDFYDLPNHLDMNENEALEPYASLKAKILEAVKKSKEKENIPPTPPIREKEDTHTDTPRACVREGFLVPTLAEVAAFIKANGLLVDAEKFWNHYNAIGWKVGKSPIRCWQSVCYVWDRGDKRQALKEAAQLAHFDAKADERAEKRQAHIDAKMDERERNRERRTGGGRRKADNNVEMSDEVREEVRRDFAL